MEIGFVSFSGIYSDLPPGTWGRKVQLHLEMMGAGDIEIALGDNTDSEKRTVSLKMDPSAWRLERTIGQGGHVRLSNPSYANFKVYLGNAFIEIIN